MEAAEKPHAVKMPHDLSPRIERLCNHSFSGAARVRSHPFYAFTTGEPWDELFDESGFYTVPKTRAFLSAHQKDLLPNAKKIHVPEDFYQQSIAQRRARFIKAAVVDHVPQELLTGDLIAGARFNFIASWCLTKKEAAARAKGTSGKNGLHSAAQAFESKGFGRCGATGGRMIPDYPIVLQKGFSGIAAEIRVEYDLLRAPEKAGPRGDELRAVMTACSIPVALAEKYAALCGALAETEADPVRRGELTRMQRNLTRVPKEPARDFYEAVQALWLAHMLTTIDENDPGAGVSFGRIDQYLLPYWQKSLAAGMERAFGKEILRCFFLHCSRAHNAMARPDCQGIAAECGQWFNLSGLGPDGKDMTNELTYVFLEVAEEMAFLPAPKPCVRLHANSPGRLLDRLIDLLARSQGAPLLLSFDERSMAGLFEEARRADVAALLNESNAFDYATVGCPGNVLCGNDRSATMDCGLNFAKALELALGNGRDLLPDRDSSGRRFHPAGGGAPRTGDPCAFRDFEALYAAFLTQLRFMLQRMTALYERGAALRADFMPTPYVSSLIRGCAERGLDATQGGAELHFVTIEGGAFATAVDSLLAVKDLVFDRRVCGMDALILALKADWAGYDVLQAMAKNRAPKYGRDDDEADALAARLTRDWANMVWAHTVKRTGARFRPGLLSQDFQSGSGLLTAATPDGRAQGQRLRHAFCQIDGADICGPTAGGNSLGKALGGCNADGTPVNLLPNGVIHAATLPPKLLCGPERRAKLKSFLRGYAQNGATALLLSIPGADTPADTTPAQKS